MRLVHVAAPARRVPVASLALVVVLLLSLTARVSAQGCSLSPADCPEGDLGASQERAVRLGNGLLPQEIDMQDAMRVLATRMMTEAANALHWEVAEISEVTNLGPLQSATTPLPLRSPRFFGIAFQFIVDADSMAAWRHWVDDFNGRYEQAGAAAYSHQNDAATSPLYAAYNDSATHYLNERVAYEQAHPRAMADEDKQIIYYTKMQDTYTNKMVQLRSAPASEDALKQLEEEKRSQTLHFRNATLLQVFFGFNDEMSGVERDDARVQAQAIHVPGTSSAVSVHVENPRLNSLAWHFTKWPDMTVLLLGRWLPPQGDPNAWAAYSLHGQADEHTPKAIPSDKVQTITIHVLGNARNRELLLPHIDLAAFNAAITSAAR